jgi:hypothetical protein
MRIARPYPRFRRQVKHHLYQEANVMKTPIHIYVPEETSAPGHRILFGLLLAAVLTSLTIAAGADDSFQQNVLFKPSQSELTAEARGRVMIYDGLDNKVVERALDTQFERIEHMMFTRTRQTQADDDGEEVIVEDDGC